MLWGRYCIVRISIGYRERAVPLVWEVLAHQRRGHRPCKAGRITPPAGQAIFWHNVFLPAQRLGPVHVAIARYPQGKELWIVASSEPTDVTTFEEYGLRFDIEENFSDDKSNGFRPAAPMP